MEIEIINKPFELDVYGFSGIATQKNYAGMAFSLSDKMWKIVKASNLKNEGKNIWVYESGDSVFAGVQLLEALPLDVSLELKKIRILRYAYYKHIGPYNLIQNAGHSLHTEIKSKGLVPGMPYIEIYGHWTNDEHKLETELLVCIEGQ